MDLKEKNLPIFSLIFSNGCFFFFWKSFCYFFMIFKKNISSFFIYSTFIFHENHHLFIKNFMEFFSFFIISQLGRIEGRKSSIFLDFFFMSIKNTKKNDFSEEIFSKIFFYSTLTLPSGFSLDFSVIPILINEILDHVNILKKVIFLEKMLLRFSKRSSKKDIITNLIIKNFLKVKSNLKFDNYFRFLTEDVCFSNFLLKKNGRIQIFMYIFLKNNSSNRFIYFSKWNLVLILKTKKKYKNTIEKIKKFFWRKRVKNLIFDSKTHILNKFIIEFFDFFLILKKNAWHLELNIKNINLFNKRKNYTKNFELTCNDIYKKDPQSFISNFSDMFFMRDKKSIKIFQNINKKKIFFYDSKLFIKLFFLKRKQTIEDYSLFLIKSYCYVKNFLNFDQYKFSKNFQKNSRFFFDLFMEEKIKTFGSSHRMDFFFFVAFYYEEKPIGTERIDFFFWRKKFLYKPFFKQKSKKNNNKTRFLKKFLLNLLKKKRNNFFSGYKIFPFFLRKLRKKEINKIFFFPKNEKKTSLNLVRILSYTFWFFPLYFLKKFEYFAFFIIWIVENSIKNFKNLNNWKQKFFNSFFSSFLIENFVNKKFFFYSIYKILHLKCHRKILFKWESACYFRISFYQVFKNQKVSFTKKDYFAIFIRNI